MGVSWTDEQLKAISTTDRGVIVPAAAGSGKTAVLIERIVRLLEDSENGCPSERLLAVTFTKDAASQMKNKLVDALSLRLANEEDPIKREWLERQQEMLPLAKICTISAFCYELVKDNPGEFDYRNGIKIADTNQAEAILAEAADRALDEMFSENGDAAGLMCLSLSSDEIGRNRKTMMEEIMKFRQILHSLPFPEQWKSNILQTFTDKDYIERLALNMTSDFDDIIDKIIKENEKAEYLAGKTKGCESLVKFFSDEREKLLVFKTPLAKSSYAEFYRAVMSFKFGRLTAPKPPKNFNDDEISDCNNTFKDVQAIRNNYKDIFKDKIKDKLKLLGDDIYQPMEYSGRIFSAVCELIDRIDKIAYDKKLELGIAEFNDIERMAMQLLVTLKDGKPQRTELAKKLAGSGTYKIMLIDEYQDVNNLQEMIFRILSDTDDLEYFGRNVFIVGDMKQSIYRFRLSNPVLFKQAVEKASSKDNTQLEKIRLSKNFRSRQNVVDFVNFVFNAIMSDKVGEIDYTNEERLVFGANYGGEDLPAELLLVKEENAQNDIDDDDDSESTSAKYVNFTEEDHRIALRIKELLDTNETVYSGNECRKCRPQDICVLVRSGVGCRRIGAALSSVGIKAQCESENGYLGSSEITTMTELLKVIDNPMRDTSLAAVMMSPIMSFTAEETAQIRILGRKEKKRLYQTILAVSKTDDADSREAQKIDTGNRLLEEKCEKAARLIKRLRFYSVSMSLEQLISRIYDETGFFAVASAYENSLQKRANLRLLTQLAAEYESGTGGTVGGFVRYMDSVGKRGKDFSQAVTVTTDDAVIVKTIHSSKGLEYPFVFLANLNKKFNLKDTSANILVSESHGVGIRYNVPEKLMRVTPISHYALKQTIRSELLSEEMRLLYVALTRAKERLFIPIYVKQKTVKKIKELADEIIKAGGINPRIISGKESYFMWIAAVLMVSPQNKPLLEAAECEELSYDLSNLCKYSGRMPEMVWRCDSGVDEVTDVKSESEKPSADDETVRRLLKKYTYKYPNTQTDSASKRTVTEIVSELHERENGESDKLFYPRPATLDESARRLTSAQRGTYTHLFMQMADYSLAEKDVRAELERLKGQGIFTEREASGVYVSAVEAFFRGGFYSRMKMSDEIRREMKFMVRASDARLDSDYGDLIAPDGMLQGICDCIFKENDGYVLVDYKTDGFKDLSELDKYKVQLDLYKRALDLILPMPVKSCFIYSFKLANGKEIFV